MTSPTFSSSSKLETDETVRTGLWPWLAGKSLENLSSISSLLDKGTKLTSKEMWSGSEEGSHSRPIDCCITIL